MFWKFIRVSCRAQMQYPSSFWMLSIGHLLGTFVDILGIWALFERFHVVKGWTLPEVAMIYGIVHMGFALAEAFSRGFDTFSQLIKQGDFDRLLLRPLSPLFQVAVREIQLMRVGRFVQGLGVLIWSMHTLSVPIFSIHSSVIVLSICGTMALFYGLFVIQATISFWTVESLEVMNIATYGGMQVGQYPMSIYEKGLRQVFTLLIPLACVVYYPIAILLRHEILPWWTGLLFPLAGGVFLVCAMGFWHLGVRRYASAGS